MKNFAGEAAKENCKGCCKSHHKEKTNNNSAEFTCDSSLINVKKPSIQRV